MATRHPAGPLSVVLPEGLRRRVAEEANRRALKLSSAVRVLVQERVQELDDVEALTRAEQWQRAQVWATWERFKAGDRREVAWDKLLFRADATLARMRKRPHRK